MTQSTCTIDGCENAPHCKKMCSKHFSRWQRRGDANWEPPTEAERFWAKVRKADGCWEWAGGKDDDGYGRFRWDGCTRMAHRFAYIIAYGGIPEGLHVDHMCHNRGCVNPVHLRLATNKQNAENRSGPAATNRASGVRGVHRNGNRWTARLGHAGEKLYFGSYSTITEAEAVVIEARRKLYTHSQD